MRQPGPTHPKNGFENLFARGKSPEVSVLEADSSHILHDKKHSGNKVRFHKLGHTTWAEPGYLIATELKDQRPAPLVNG